MEKSKKAKKNHGEEEEATEKDRLSDLPDSILLHILSFLPEIRFCVRTTLLSKRWKNLWASLPDLIFHKRKSRKAQSFKRFVRNVLKRRENLPVNKLIFNYGQKDKSVITSIIKYAMSHNVKHLRIMAKSSLTYLSPFFNISLTLKSLTLAYFDNMHLLEDFTIPSLTSLSLWWCTFGGEGEGEGEPISIDPFVGLFNLKRLKLGACSGSARRFEIRRPLLSRDRVRNFKITGPRLDTLTILGHCDCKLEIFAPKLGCFSATFVSLMKFSGLPLLESANIDVDLPFHDGKEAFVKSLLDLINMFRALYNARSLVLSYRFIKDLMECPEVLEDQSSPFVRLKTLKVRCYGRYSHSFNIPDNVIKF